MKKIIAVDVDGTLCQEVCWTPDECLNATPNEEIISKVNSLFLKNFIIIYTARRDNLISETLKWLRIHNVRFHAISNLKMPADLYIDDLSTHPDALQIY